MSVNYGSQVKDRNQIKEEEQGQITRPRSKSMNDEPKPRGGSNQLK